MPRPPANTKITSKPKAVSATRNQLRIIGGQWRGRKLSFPDVEGLRPTGDRIRETLFNWLAPEIKNARCLDLFSGSGALGFEALSRGATLCVMIERDTQAARHLKTNSEHLAANNAHIFHTSAVDFLSKQNNSETFDIIFIDPPFDLNLWPAVFEQLEANNWLSETASIYVESPRDYPLQTPATWQMHRDKQAGQVSYRLFYRSSHHSNSHEP